MRQLPIVSLVFGIAACALVLAFRSPLALSASGERRSLGILIQQCIEKDRPEAAATNPSFELDCDPWSLEHTDRQERRRYLQDKAVNPAARYVPMRGIQGEIVRLQRDVSEWETLFVKAAILLAVAGIAPLIWGFVLRRLREIGSALRGSASENLNSRKD